jgi:hypothetical protein
MKDTANAAGRGFGDHCARVIFRVTRVNDNRFVHFARKAKLFSECPSLLEAR